MREPCFLARVTLVVAALVLAGLVVAPAPVRSEILNLPPHPRIIVYGISTQPTRLEELRQQVDETGDPQQWSERKKALVVAFRSLRAGSWVWNRLDLEAEWDDRPVNQDEQYRCLATLALTDLLMKNKGSFYPEYAEGRVYAAKADAFFHWWRDHGDHNWGEDPDQFAHPLQLGYAELLAGYALFYDWCYDYLTAPERAYHARSIYHLMTDANHLYIFPYGDWRYGWYDNNHVGVIFGAVGLAGLALDQSDPVFNAVARDSIALYRQLAASRVSDYLDASFPGGAGIEGVLYANYGLNLALPYAFATDRLGAVGAGFDPLPANERVIGQHNAYQVPTWFYYEQLPFNTCGGTPLNDTNPPPEDLNPSIRAWPWLMAFSTPLSRNLATPFFYTIYPPAMIESAVRAAFDYRNPDATNDPFDILGVTNPTPRCSPGDQNSCGILLGFPEATPYPALDPRSLPRGRYFSGRGITYFRTGVQLLKPDGTLDWKPDSCLITFECRQHPTYPPGYQQWLGHTQQDVNHFTAFFAGEPLFYDSGYGCCAAWPSFYSYAHSLHEVSINGGAWHGFADLRTMGLALGSVLGFGIDPSMAAGDNTECWNSAEVSRSRRRIVVLPRPGKPAPYFFLHDDFQLASSGKVRALVQTGNTYVGGVANAPRIGGNVVRWDKGNARAVLGFLSPGNMALTINVLTPSYPLEWPAHWMIFGEVPSTGTRHQIVSMVEPRLTGDSSPELLSLYVVIPNNDPEGLAYQVQSGRFTDVVAFRPADHAQDWIIEPQGYAPIDAGSATVVAVRFDGPGPSVEALHSAMMNGRGSGSLCYGGRPVAACASESDFAMSFSEDGVALWTAAGDAPAYFIAPFVPRAAIINGAPAPVSMLPVPPAMSCVSPEDVASATDGARGAGRQAWTEAGGPVIPNPLRVGAGIEWGAENAAGSATPTTGFATPAALEVYDVCGRLLRTIHGEAGRGLHIWWDGRTSSGRQMPSGVYILRARQGRSKWSRSVLFLR